MVSDMVRRDYSPPHQTSDGRTRRRPEPQHLVNARRQIRTRDRDNGGFDGFELHVTSVRTGAERRRSRVHRHTAVQHMRAPRSTAERLKHKRLASRALCDREQRGARPIDTVCAVTVVAPGREHMLLVVGVIVLSVVVIIPRMRVPGGVNASTRGWMSDKWLAEHRASHSR